MFFVEVIWSLFLGAGQIFQVRSVDLPDDMCYNILTHTYSFFYESLTTYATFVFLYLYQILTDYMVYLYKIF